MHCWKHRVEVDSDDESEGDWTSGQGWRRPQPPTPEMPSTLVQIPAADIVKVLLL
jgi:hypothetical protein